MDSFDSQLTIEYGGLQGDSDNCKLESMQFVIRKSSIAGDGAFAAHPFVIGESVGEAFSFNKSFLPYLHMSVDKEIYRTHLGRYVNHSSTPNCGIRESVQRNLCVLEYVAKKPIDSGDEITVDYRNIPWVGKREFVVYN